MRNLTALFLILFCSLSLMSQNYITTKEAPEKIKAAFKIAYAEFNAGNYDQSIKELEKIIKKD